MKAMEGVFNPEACLHLHWKPSVFPWRMTTGSGPVLNPHGQPPRGKILSLAFFGFHWLDFLLGTHLRIGPAIRRGGFVLVERYYYDFFVDRRRYRLDVPGWVVNWGAALLRKPDRVVLLDADPHLLQSRKQELPLQETARQREAYLALIKNFSNGRTVDTARPLESVVSEIRQVIMGSLPDPDAVR
jgi:thymidylate kinase